MTLVKRNVIANFAGQGWSAFMALAFVPLYIKFLGIEAYGLIGFFAMLQGTFQILDFGLSQTMNREMARYSVLPGKAAEARDLVRTLEIGYWAIGVVLGFGVVCSAPFIARNWINIGTIPVETVQQAIMIMGVMSALQWPLSFYEGGLMGLQKQVLSNSIKIGMATLSSCGAAFILWKVSPTITAFFTWQIIVAVLYVTLFTIFLWRSLPPAEGSPRFHLGLLRNIWRFAAGMSGIGISAIILMQMDKILLSKLLSLEMFGYYILAGTISSAIPTLLVSPIFNGLFPRFSSLVVANDEISLKNLYHQGVQLTATIILPIATVMALFSYDILLLWTQNAEAARIASPLVTLLVVGMALNGLTALTFALQLSYGWTKIGIGINIFLIITLVPAVYFMTTHYGAVGAAAVWLALNSIYLIIVVPLTHRRFLRGEAQRWYLEDIGPPLLASLAVAGLGRWLIASPMTTMVTIAILSSIVLGATALSAFAAPRVRTWILTELI
ncbi:MAG: oligosaccharide flippase family protein [Nitrospirae bacterium]|nr:oligosaccharide flippase family protein [Nitrospirota bacterium]